jgi:16S rRNA (adenine1518-N6/adenine1519-N6)-dimethyltransferase
VARQRLGQHFLGAGWRERVIDAALGRAASADGVWIEIGAGHGEMTALLASQASSVVAIELDAKLLPGLRALAARLGNVSVVSGDVLSMNLEDLAGGQRFRVYGNIPYYITSPIVHHLFARPERLEAAFLVMQLEVAERLAARPGRREYGYLSAFTQYYAESEILLRIPRGAFRPPPEVASALVALRLPGQRATLGVRDEAAFVEFLKGCFAQKRKTLRNNLRAMTPAGRAEALLAECGIAREARAEQLSLPELARIFAGVRSSA